LIKNLKKIQRRVFTEKGFGLFFTVPGSLSPHQGKVASGTTIRARLSREQAHFLTLD